MFCPMCGAPHADEDVYCGNCGAALTPDEGPAEAGAQAPGGSATGTKAKGKAPPETVEEIVEETAAEESAEAQADKPWPEPPEERKIAPAVPPPPPAPQAPAGPVPSLPTSGLAIASLVLGVGGLTILPLLGSILAIILGYMARKDIRSRPGELTGDGLAMAGIVMGWIAVGLSVLGLLFVGSLGLCGICTSMGASY